MRLYKLKLNDDKTDILLFPSNPLKTSPSVTITIGTDQISPSAVAKNLGVTLDPSMSLAPHITNICKAANYHLYRISHIRKYLTPNATQTIIHSHLITNRLLEQHITWPSQIPTKPTPDVPKQRHLTDVSVWEI